MSKIRQMSRSHVVYEGLKQFEHAPAGFELDYRDVPGLSRFSSAATEAAIIVTSVHIR